MNQIFDFFYSFKNKEIETSEIITYENTISEFAQDIKKSSYYKEIYNNYLLIRGYTYRLDDASLRLFYTFKEAIYALDLAKLTRDEAGITLNSAVYALVIDDCIKEFLKKDIDLLVKEEAISFYKKEEAKKAKENKKYHMYQN